MRHKALREFGAGRVQTSSVILSPAKRPDLAAFRKTKGISSSLTHARHLARHQPQTATELDAHHSGDSNTPIHNLLPHKCSHQKNTWSSTVSCAPTPPGPWAPRGSRLMVACHARGTPAHRSQHRSTQPGSRQRKQVLPT